MVLHSDNFGNGEKPKNSETQEAFEEDRSYMLQGNGGKGRKDRCKALQGVSART